MNVLFHIDLMTIEAKEGIKFAIDFIARPVDCKELVEMMKST